MDLFKPRQIQKEIAAAIASMASFTLNLTLVGIRKIYTTHTKSKSKTYPKLNCFREKDRQNAHFIKIIIPLLHSLLLLLSALN
jgi:hypothetical protein